MSLSNDSGGVSPRCHQSTWLLAGLSLGDIGTKDQRGDLPAEMSSPSPAVQPPPLPRPRRDLAVPPAFGVPAGAAPSRASRGAVGVSPLQPSHFAHRRDAHQPGGGFSPIYGANPFDQVFLSPSQFLTPTHLE